jgi:manganese/zinc/iron transport system permease protein
MIPPFDTHKILVLPWTESLATYGWVVVMGFLVTLACGLLGNFLILRRLALVGDAISHSILPGIVIAYLLGRTRGPVAMFAGAVAAGMLTTFLIELIQRRSRIKQDAAIGIVFSTFFAVGVLLISLYAGHVDLDADCVLYGDLGYAGLETPVIIFGYSTAPPAVLVMAAVCVLVIAFIIFFYKELLVTCFDSALASSVGISPAVFHYALMALLSVVVVSAFKAVGAILVVATLILPGATAYLLASRLPLMLALSALHAAISAVAGMHLSVWLDCSVGAAVVVAGAFLFAIAWASTGVGRAIARSHAARPQGDDVPPVKSGSI